MVGTRFILLAVCLCLFSLSAVASQKKIYVWRDAKGVLVFSDTPQKNAEELNLNVSSIDMQAVDTSILYEETSTTTPDTAKFEIEITEPQHQATIRENSGSVYVSGRVSPRFENGLKIQLFLDGIATKEPQSSSIFALRDVDRGEHTLQMRLIDKDGKEISKSKSIIIYLHRKGL
ncbi:DUF4124 domain-containing protein [Pseudoalteromonas tunicata]|nr:DUF4124 domain-containing protein [Pseudoalteromonas tunicata]